MEDPGRRSYVLGAEDLAERDQGKKKRGKWLGFGDRGDFAFPNAAILRIAG